jgi:hypothetical protein
LTIGRPGASGCAAERIRVIRKITAKETFVMLSPGRLAAVAAVLVTGGLLAAPGLAFADAPTNDHNCQGAVVSGVTPEVTSNDFGQTVVRPKATAGERDDFVQDFNDESVNCGQRQERP